MTDSSQRTNGDGYKHRVASYRVAESIIMLHEEIEKETRNWVRDSLKKELLNLQKQFNEMTRYAEE